MTCRRKWMLKLVTTNVMMIMWLLLCFMIEKEAYFWWSISPCKFYGGLCVWTHRVILFLLLQLHVYLTVSLVKKDVIIFSLWRYIAKAEIGSIFRKALFTVGFFLFSSVNQCDKYFGWAPLLFLNSTFGVKSLWYATAISMYVHVAEFPKITFRFYLN